MVSSGIFLSTIFFLLQFFFKGIYGFSCLWFIYVYIRLYIYLYVCAYLYIVHFCTYTYEDINIYIQMDFNNYKSMSSIF